MLSALRAPTSSPELARIHFHKVGRTGFSLPATALFIRIGKKINLKFGEIFNREFLQILHVPLMYGFPKYGHICDYHMILIPINAQLPIARHNHIGSSPKHYTGDEDDVLWPYLNFFQMKNPLRLI